MKVKQKCFKQKSVAEVQADHMEEFREMKQFLYEKFNWISKVERKKIKERCDGV